MKKALVTLILLAAIVILTLCILGVLIPSWTRNQAEDPVKNPHFTRRVFGMRREKK